MAVPRYLPYGQPIEILDSLPTDKTFTGQREKDFELMDYNARYFSSLLGRFVSADSIILGAGDLLAWGRYLYGLGNPIKYSDPTGHSVDCAIGEPGCRAGKVAPSPEPEIVLGPLGSSLKSGYEELRNTPGYWNDFGKSDFTMDDFLGLFTYWEIYSLGDGSQDESLLEAAARRMYDYCKGKCSADQTFDFLARNGGDVQISRINAMRAGSRAGIPGTRGGSIGQMMAKARWWGYRIANTPSWKIHDGNRPSDWGNPGATTYDLVAVAVDIHEKTPGNYVNRQTADEHGIFYWKGNFMILTANQAAYWMNNP